MNIDVIRTLYSNFEDDSVIQNLIAQANSRYILYNALEPEMNFPNYTKKLDERCLHIAFTYLNFGWDFYMRDNRDESLFCIEKAAGILEHLYAYEQCGKVYKEFYNLICALAYYVVSQYSKSFIVLKNYTCDTDIAKMINSFVIRDFKTLSRTISNIQFNKLSINEDKDSMETCVYENILSIAFNNMLAYIYTGDLDYVESAKDILIDLIELSKINEEPYMWWVFKLVFLIFDEFITASLWSILPSIIMDEQDRKKYIYANIYKNVPIVELFKSQRDCLQLSEGYEKGFVIGMPTSSGKTKVAEISLVKTLSQYPEALCIYIAPFRSLANEIESSLSLALRVIGYSVSHLYGSSQATQKDRRTVLEANVIIATPEKVKSILRANPDLEHRIKLVIVDEGHLVGAQPRYITSELLIEELKYILGKNEGKLIILSAVLPNLSDFSKWVSGEENNVALSMWRPSAQRFGELDFSNNTVNLRWIGDPPSFNNKFINTKIKKEARITTTGKEYPAKYFPEDKKEAVGATAVKMLSMGSVLIYVGRSTMVLSQARIVSKLMQEKNIFHQWKNTNNLKLVELTCEESYGENSEVYTFVTQGIICHSSKLPTDVRMSIERLIAQESPKVVIATSTLGQGVNLGVSTVIISNVYLDETNTVDVKDFWNIAGRAGRAFTDTEGKVLFTIDRLKSDYSINNQFGLMKQYFQHDNIEKATSGLYFLLKELLCIAEHCKIDYEMLLEILAENKEVIDEEGRIQYFKEAQKYLDLLDDTLLSINVRHNSEDQSDCANWIDNVFNTSLAYIQSIDDFDSEKSQVIDILKARSKGVIKLAGNPIHWKALVSSSIPLKASLYIDKYLDMIIGIVREYLDSFQSFDELMELIGKLDEFVSDLPLSFPLDLMEGAKQFSIRNVWYGGDTIEEISNLFNKSDKVCSQYYSFHFPWIINAISKKIFLLGAKEESKILEDISLFSEIGVSDIISAKIYLAGVKSRKCSIELSNFIDEEDDTGFSIEKKLTELIDRHNNDEIVLSDKSMQWLELINVDYKNKEYQEISPMIIDVQYEMVKCYDRLYCKSYENKIYLCSWDYKIKILIKNECFKEFSCFVDILGIYFERTQDNLWQLISENPYIVIS